MDDQPLVIDQELVKHLIADQFPHWKQLPIKPVVCSGWDNRTFCLGDDKLVRLPSAAIYAQQVSKEHRFLPKLAPQLPFCIPEPLARGQPACGYPWSWSVYRWLKGESALEALDIDLDGLAVDLSYFLRVLQSLDVTGGPIAGDHSFHRGGDLSVYEGQVQQALIQLEGKIDTQRASQLFKKALGSPYRGLPVWVHGDVSAGNLLLQEGRLSAVIDFGQLAVGDPACDLVIAWTLFQGKSRQLFYDHLALDADTWRRARGWALWKALIIAAGFSGCHHPQSQLCWRVIEELYGEEQGS